MPEDFEQYHIWQEQVGFPHQQAFVAPSRFCTPPDAIASLLLNETVDGLMSELGLPSWAPVDEGMGWLGYRIIRPGRGDGYPLSRKNWGASPGVISFWLPMWGFGDEYSLRYVPGSQTRDYKHYLPTESQFTKGELRLDPSEEVEVQSQYVGPGEALVYGPDTLHSENVPSGSRTRVNLEFRLLPS